MLAGEVLRRCVRCGCFSSRVPRRIVGVRGSRWQNFTPPFSGPGIYFHTLVIFVIKQFAVCRVRVVSLPSIRANRTRWVDSQFAATERKSHGSEASCPD